MTKQAAANPENQVTEHDVTDKAGNKLGNRCRATAMPGPYPDHRTSDERRCTFIIGHTSLHSWEATDAKPIEQDAPPVTDAQARATKGH
jgi:hypothetical protein